MATSLKAVIALSEDPTVDNFLDVQNNCTNEPALTGDKNRLSSWEKYFYYTNYTISTSLSSSSVAASGGAITITYTIKQNASNSNGSAKVVSGVTPTVTSTIGTVSNITATNSNGVGTAKITVGSLGTTIQDITTGIITVSSNGSSKSSNFTRSLNDVTSIKIAGSIPATGAYSNPTTYYPAAGSSYVHTVYAYFSSGAGEGNFSVTQNAYSISGDGFSKAQYSTATYAISTTAANRTTIIGDERSGVLTASYTTQITKKTLTDSITLTQAANVRSLSSVYTVPYKPDSSWITDITGSGSSTNWATVPASGGYLKSHAYANYTHTSGSPLNNQHITTDAAFAWSGSPSWITKHSSGGYYVNPNCGNADTRNSTGTYSYTYNGVKKTCTEAITQSGDTYTDSWDYKTDASLSKTSATCSSGTLTLTVKVYRRKYRNWGCGTDGYITDYTLFDTTPAVSDNVDWLSVGSFTKSSTGTYTATVTYNANSKNTSARTATITVTANSKSSTATLTQSKDTYTESGGVITYGNITGCSTTDGDIPCSGGSATAKASNGTQSWTKTAKIRTWSCGGTETIESADSGSITVYPSPSSYTGSANSKGTTESGWTKIGSKTVTWSSNGKTVTDSLEIWQAPNQYTDKGGGVTYGSWTGGSISFNSTSSLSAGADSRTVTIQPWSRTKTTAAVIREWCSGSEQTISNASSSTEYYTGKVSVSENGTYTSLSSTSYTASSSAKTLTLTKSTCGSTPTSATTVTITADPTTSGPSTTTASISQQANQKDYNQTVLSLYHVIETTNLPAEADYTRVYMEGEVQKCYTSGAGCSTTTQTWAVDNVTSNVSWITFNSTDGTIRWDENTSPSSRSATLTIKYGSYSRNVNVTQEAGSSSAMLYIETAYYYSSTPGDWTVKFKYGSTTYSTVTASHAEYSSSGTQIIGVVVPDVVLNDTSTKSYTVVVEFGTGYESWSGTLSYSNRNKLRDGYSVTINAF